MNAPSDSRNLAIFIDWFAPGYKAGGPIRSVVNLAELLAGEVTIWVFTSDRDHQATSPYPGIPQDQWVSWKPNIKVWYSSPAKFSKMEEALRSLSPDVVYINSVFSVQYAITPLRWHVKKSIAERVVITPRGTLRKSALKFGFLKKWGFIQVTRMLGYQNQLIWQGTDDLEVEDIYKNYGRKLENIKIGNVPTVTAPIREAFTKQSGQIDILMVSRIQSIKNLHFFFNILQMGITGDINVDLIGPMEDEGYWQDCQELISHLPDSITVRALGPMPHHEIVSKQQEYHLFVLPTTGENFGHAIFDALLGGLPVMISDQTPWKGLAEKECGWDLSLHEKQAWKVALEQAISWNSTEFQQHSQASSAFAQRFLKQSNLKQQYLDLFFPHRHEA